MRGVGRDLRTRGGDGLGHFGQDLEPGQAGLVDGLVQNVERDPADLHVELDGGHALFRPGDLEVHVAEVVLHAGDVGQDPVAVALLDQSHGDPGHGHGQGYARVHERQDASADAGHGG